MTRWLEFQSGPLIDRYKITGLSVDEFIDIIIVPFLNQFKEITEEAYESKKSHELSWNYSNKYQIEKYVLKHPSKEARNLYNQRVRKIRREKFLESFNDEELS